MFDWLNSKIPKFNYVSVHRIRTAPNTPIYWPVLDDLNQSDKILVRLLEPKPVKHMKVQILHKYMYCTNSQQNTCGMVREPKESAMMARGQKLLAVGKTDEEQ